MTEKSLYDRLGGEPAVSAVVDDFAGRVQADTRINAQFAKTDAARLVANLKSFICSATGGPCKYHGNTMKAAHHNMGVTQGEFGALGPLGPDIVESQSTATGTALPKTFVPAKPMPATSHKGDKKHM